MTPFAGEWIGTALFVLLGNSVQANALLGRTKGESGEWPWLLVATGWAMALFAAGAIVAASGGAHLNPAVTMAHWQRGAIGPGEAATLIGGQFLGAAIGAVLVYLLFLPHWGRTDDPGRKLACFANAPAVRAPIANLLGEAVGTFVLVLGILVVRDAAITPAAGSVPSSMQAVASVEVHMGALGALPAALLLWAVAMGLGGSVGVGFNPARDLAPRLVHAIVPIRGKGPSDWSYAWIPVVGPLLGAAAAAAVAAGWPR